MTKLTCKHCSKTFIYIPPLYNKNRVRKTCSKKCQYEFMWGKVDKKSLSEKHRKTKMGSRNPQWRGSQVTVRQLHKWVKRHKAIPKVCAFCKASKKLDLCNIAPKPNNKTYNRDLNNWIYLCRKCHMESDGRLSKLIIKAKELSKANKRTCKLCENKYYAKNLCKKHYYRERYKALYSS